jgi:hypothetical protein
MANVTVKTPYPKSDPNNTKDVIAHIQQSILANRANTGVISCDISEDSNNYYLTTVYASVS